MEFLLDSGVLIRLTEPSDPDHRLVSDATDILWARGDRLVASPQNLIEFWAVCTRPARERSGLGLDLPEVDSRLRYLESVIDILPDPPSLFWSWWQIVFDHKVLGKQVHDARLAAFMHDHNIPNLVTLNEKDFVRYSWLKVVHPRDIVGGPSIAAPAP